MPDARCLNKNSAPRTPNLENHSRHDNYSNTENILKHVGSFLLFISIPSNAFDTAKAEPAQQSRASVDFIEFL
jgi:hypothetical protein